MVFGMLYYSCVFLSQHTVVVALCKYIDYYLFDLLLFKFTSETSSVSSNVHKCFDDGSVDVFRPMAINGVSFCLICNCLY